ncbi:MAG: hypothetical protein M1813_001828 [Trichoglossum hirsutum]|nr:MAG: hypothetical protein M1813_001828 [Trichoglossum hirsutum]
MISAIQCVHIGDVAVYFNGANCGAFPEAMFPIDSSMDNICQHLKGLDSDERIKSARVWDYVNEGGLACTFYSDTDCSNDAADSYRSPVNEDPPCPRPPVNRIWQSVRCLVIKPCETRQVGSFEVSNFVTANHGLSPAHLDDLDSMADEISETWNTITTGGSKTISLTGHNGHSLGHANVGIVSPGTNQSPPEATVRDFTFHCLARMVMTGPATTNANIQISNLFNQVVGNIIVATT